MFNTWQWILWSIVAAIVILPFPISFALGNAGEWIRGYYGRELRLFCQNNNTRARYGLYLMVLLVISAFLAGGGQPLLEEIPKTEATLAKVKDAFMPSDNQKRAWSSLLYAGSDQEPPLQQTLLLPPPLPPPSTPKVYSSWWHVIVAIAGVVIFPVYWLFSWREEIYAAALRVIRRRRAARTVHAGGPAPGAPAPASTPTPAERSPEESRSSWLKRILQEIGVEGFAEIIGEFFVAMFFERRPLRRP